MTYRRIKHEKKHPEKFERRNRREEFQNYEYIEGLSNIFAFRKCHIADRYVQRVTVDPDARYRSEESICRIIAHSIEESELPRIREGQEYHALVHIHLHPLGAEHMSIPLQDVFIPLKRSKLNGTLIVPTILNAEERGAYFQRREYEEARVKRRKKPRRVV